MTKVLEVRLRGGLLVGGLTSAGLNDATMRDGKGIPFLPASAVKGAIREQLARLVAKDRVTRILGGPGVGPADDGEATPVDERFGGGNTRVYLGDAVLVDNHLKEWFESGLGYARKPQVSIERRSRRAADKLFFQREILAPFADRANGANGLRFHAPVDLSHLDSADRDAFEAAVEAVFALGAGRTAGLGGVEMEIKDEIEDDTTKDEPNEPTRKIRDSDVAEVVLEAMDPLCLGVDKASGNFHRTLSYLPASTLRGAVVTAALRQQGKIETDQSSDPEFVEAVLDPRTCLRFGDAHPGDAVSPMAAPVTLRTCKTGGESHGVVDTLIRDFLVTQLADRGVYVAPDESCSFPGCGQRLIPAKRMPGRLEPQRRVVTRLGLDGPSARGADGQLFSLELLERGTRLVATVSGIGPKGRKLLAAAAQGEMRAGHGRGQGYGRLRIADIRPAPTDDLAERLRLFDGRVATGLRHLASTVDPQPIGAHQYLAATLLTDLIPTDLHLPAEEALAAALGIDLLEVVYGQVRTGLRGGWDARRRGPKSYEPVVRAGSVLLLRTSTPLDELRPGLAELEERGAGKAREEGYGWIRFSDSIHSSEWRNP